MRVLFKKDDRLPFVEIRSVFFGGVLEESHADSGITQLMSQGLLKGTTESIRCRVDGIHRIHRRQY
jgi:predicted Zn-dependent peptidase